MASILIESAVESVACAIAAVGVGAGRLELCADLARGGVTPSAGLIRAVRSAVDVPLMVLVRPRPGDFSYSAAELDVMRHDVREARRAGANGVVLGVLTPAGTIDESAMRLLAAAAGTLDVVMHRAVDQSPDVVEACRTLVALGVRRVLTSGGALSAHAGAATIATLVATYGERLTIMAGGQVRADTVRELLRRTGVREIHLGPRRRVGAAGMGARDALDVEQLAAVVRAVNGIVGEQ
jgi:copper homeostasis protein